ARRRVAKGARAPRERRDAEEELAAGQPERARRASPRPDLAPEAGRPELRERAVSPQPAEAREWPASSEPLLAPPLSPPCLQRPQLQRQHPARPRPASPRHPSPPPPPASSS